MSEPTETTTREQISTSIIAEVLPGETVTLVKRTRSSQYGSQSHEHSIEISSEQHRKLSDS